MSELPGSFKAILTIIANLDFFFKIFLFIFGCAGSLLLHNFFFFLPVVASGGYSVVLVCGPLL